MSPVEPGGDAAVRVLEGELRRIVAAEVTEQCRTAENAGRDLDLMDQRQVARAVLQRELDRSEEEGLRLGRQPMPPGDRHDLMERVLTQVFSPLPGLEGFLADERATNIHVLGCREVVVELLDGTTQRFRSPFESDQQVIDTVAQIARRGGTVEQEFNYSRPMLHMTMADGSRLSAHAWIGSEPHVTIRRHPLVDYDLDDLAGLGMVDGTVRSLLGAAVRANWNVLVAGAQGAGKTTLLRALAHEAPRDERLVVMESEPELSLEQLPHRHNHVVALAERPGNMAGEGAVRLDDLVWHAKRLSPVRLIVGEVLADEVVPMLEAMTQGVPAMGTIHAESSAAVFPRLPVYARSRGRDWRSEDIAALAAVALDLIVFLARDRAGTRVVAEVRHIDRYDHNSRQVISDAWFAPDRATGRATPASVIPVALLDELIDHGYRPASTPGTRSAGNGHPPAGRHNLVAPGDAPAGAEVVDLGAGHSLVGGGS